MKSIVCRLTLWKAALSARVVEPPYPPGIPLLVPGERVNSKIVEYLRFARDFTRRFPGFESDVHGLVKVKQPDGTIKYMLDCVRED